MRHLSTFSFPAFLKRYYKELLIFIGIFLAFFINASYVVYPDEFVNIMGGKFILEGKAPYREFFDHHMPFAWYLSSFLLLFSFKSFVLFRILWASLVFVSLLGLGLWMRRVAKDIYPYYLGFFIFYPLMSVYFWFHLYLADSIAILFFSLTFWILLTETLKERRNFKAIAAASFFTFLLVTSSLTFIYLAMALYLWQVYLVGFQARKLIEYSVIAAVPYIVFVLLLLVTGALTDFLYFNFVYNVNQYIDIPNYTRGRFFNPVKFALTLIYNFHTNYTPVLTKITHPNIYLPIDVFAAFGSLILLILLFFRNFILGVIFFFAISFSAPRSNLQTINETDYQVALFLVLGVAGAFASMYLLSKVRRDEFIVRDLKRVAQVVLVIFMFFSFVFLAQNTYNKYYLRYTQKMPRVNDLAHTANFIDRVLDREDYYWIGPYEPHEIFFVKEAKLPGKYIHLLPQFSENETLKQSFIQQFETNKPKIIIYRQEASIFNTPSLQFGAFFLDWMKDKYTAVEKIEGVTVKQSPSTFNLATDTYLLNESSEELLGTMKQGGFIE